MKKLAQFSVANPVAILMLVLGVLLLGYISFQRLGMDLFPDLNHPRLFIELSAGDQPPEEIEKRFIETLESQASRQRGVIGVASAIRVGSAQTTVSYSWKTDMDEAFLNLQKAIASIGQDPDIRKIAITQHDPNAEPIMTLVLRHPEVTDLNQLRLVAQNYIRNELIRLEGVAGVEISGQQEQEVLIATDEYLLEAYGLSPALIAEKIQSFNRNASGGSVTEMGLRYLIKGESIFNSLEDLENLILVWKSGADPSQQATNNSGDKQTASRVPVYLKDVATVALKNNDPQSLIRYQGQRGLGLQVYKEMKHNTVQATDSILDEIEIIRAALPGYELFVVQNQGDFIATAIGEVKQTALIGILLAILVLFVFLRRIGTTIIVSIAIPISVIATFNLMYFSNLSLNMMTLGGLALGAGMLVDNAIIVMENIIRQLESGKRIVDAAIDGTAQVAGAITASTITTIVVFLPIVYLNGASGELFKDQAWTVAFSLVSSLGVALLVIPMLSRKFLRIKGRDVEQSAAAGKEKSIRFPWYSDLLAKVLTWRWPVVIASAALVAFAVFLIPIIGSEFIPHSGLDEFSLQLTLPDGTTLQRTENTVISIEESISQAIGGQVSGLYSRMGQVDGLSANTQDIFQDENTASIRVTLEKDHPTPTDQLMVQLGVLLRDIPDVDIQFVADQTALRATLGTETAPVVVEVSGDDLAVLEELTQLIQAELASTPELLNIETNLEQGRPEVNISIDRMRAGFFNIGVADITNQLKDLLGGTTAGYWESGGEKSLIQIKLPEIGLAGLQNLTLKAGDRKFKLAEIADTSTSHAPREILRKNQVRYGRVTAHMDGSRPFDHIILDVRNKLAQIDLPPEYSLAITGEEERRQKEFNDLRFAFLLSIVLVYMVLASQFGSLIHPFAILLTIPLAGVGAVFTFFLMGIPFSIMAYIGIILLVGIAVNDSIILVDAINKLKEEGLAARLAIIEAGQQRIRPIVMTSATTILALLPLTVGFGEGAALRAPMALAVIGGLVTSTILTLFVIPCVYSLLDRAGNQ